jgi:hypothetical protein
MRTIYRAAAGVAALALVATTGCAVHVGGSRRPRTARETVVYQQPAVYGGGPAVIVDGHHHRHHHHETIRVDD